MAEISHEDARDPVSIRIDDILLHLPSSSLPLSHLIFRIDNYLENTKDRLLDPNLVSIGPIHHGKDHLQKMEHHKFRYLKSLLQRRNESSVDEYVVALRSMETTAYGCYANLVQLCSDEFVEMLLLDGCFIIELIRKFKFHHLREKGDPIFTYTEIMDQLVVDLMLVENQIPFVVLDKLFSMTKIESAEDNLISLIQQIVRRCYPWRPQEVCGEDQVQTTNVAHLLGLMYDTWSTGSVPEPRAKLDTNFVRCAKLTRKSATEKGRWAKLDINSAAELLEAGIEFETNVETNDLEIKFIEGVIKIPPITIDDGMELGLRNLIVHEHYFCDYSKHPMYVTDYAFFLRCLINSSNDVRVLRHKGILCNMLGDDDMVLHMIQRLGQNIKLSSQHSYIEIVDRVNAHCRRRRNRWMANLKHNYFNSPWAYVSFFAAVILLFLTLIQTVFTILSYAKAK